jgi:hypothetical protein
MYDDDEDPWKVWLVLAGVIVGIFLALTLLYPSAEPEPIVLDAPTVTTVIDADWTVFAVRPTTVTTVIDADWTVLKVRP